MLVGEQIAFLSRAFTPRTVFMEIGAGDCALAVRAAGYVEPGDVDWKGLQEEVQRLRGRLQSFGNVNMLALEKLQEALA